MLTKEQARHIAKLARLGLKDDGIDLFAKQLSEILTYVEKLDVVDTSNVIPTSQTTDLKNVMREDKVEAFPGREELLACSELPVIEKQIKVKPVISN
jgi:aspartyl-tRNA(Asn)/glutamyl-tRNA(Gln) amidotransferase subunit C